jgi:fumarylpyruvate hydrolase
MEYVIPVLPTPSLAVEGARGRFPVHRIYCVGRNYAEHAREMGHDPDREPPLPASRALDLVYGYAVGLDMTRRDLQGEAKKMGRPWDTGKAFDGSAPCSPIRRASEIGHPTKGAVWLEVNGTSRQRGDLSQLIWKIPEMIAYLSTLFALAPGDLIFTGTPSGVGQVDRGDVLKGGVDGVGALTVRVV